MTCNPKLAMGLLSGLAAGECQRLLLGSLDHSIHPAEVWSYADSEDGDIADLCGRTDQPHKLPAVSKMAEDRAAGLNLHRAGGGGGMTV